ncbi:sugar phosphate isomerase/epimerase [Coraliomargarita sinensis]|uniref:Sugar phosphate isomerase/epimerase n=1 Tax=Coraliomargarita sinensis TaxID=2174842 RepID=A0A317ZDV7_9BACT|nr:sugar phosphate isomerase/epimerase family protein [Coraliomargarita sinensis]PXA03544.1 sugar phosphate isomerase/epimerase [Coraliomargarita sinensis]
MLYSGLCSITFRQHSVEEVIALCQQAGIEGIEWGGDVHVPPGEAALAASVKAKTEAAGLKVSSYGSYNKCDRESGPISEELESADALGAPVIRVWAGRKASADAGADYRAEVVEHLKRAVVAARELDITIALEYHRNTLTDTQASAHQLLREVGLPELKLYWQPRTSEGDRASNLAELEAALPKLAHIHCFHWGMGGFKDRYPLLDGTGDWKAYLDAVRGLEEDRYVILEFVKDDSPEQFLEDTKVLNALLKNDH